MRTLSAFIAAACLIGAAALVQGCDATTAGVQVQSPSPYPYNPRW
jgi:hypothetical protein